VTTPLFIKKCIRFLLNHEKKSHVLYGIFLGEKMEEEKISPLRRWKGGRFQVSIWKRLKVFEPLHEFDVERRVEEVRACVQFSYFNRTVLTWENQQIWCSPGELKTLLRLLSDAAEDRKAKK
jgi:hypothetical protein